MSLKTAQTHFEQAMKKDKGTIMDAREICSAAAELYAAANMELTSRLEKQEPFSFEWAKQMLGYNLK